MIQNPEAAIFGTRERWKSQGRFVLDTEQDRGAKIFVRPSSGRGYTLADAFDITQTQARYHDHGFNREYSREGCELSAQSVAYILCRRFGVSQAQPDLSRLTGYFQGWPVQNRQNMLNGIQDLSKRIGRAIEQSIAPPQRAAPTVRRDAR